MIAGVNGSWTELHIKHVCLIHSGDNVRVRHNMNADETRQQLYQNYYVKVTFKVGFYSMPSNVPRKL